MLKAISRQLSLKEHHPAQIKEVSKDVIELFHSRKIEQHQVAGAVFGYLFAE
jgi:hypothetical protein